MGGDTGYLMRTLVLVIGLLVSIFAFFTLNQGFWVELGIATLGGYLVGIATSPFQQKATSKSDDDEPDEDSPIEE